MGEILRVAAYCRVSTEKEDQLNSLETQREFFRQYIARRENWQLVSVFADEGLSGTSAARRPRFSAMIDLAQRGKLDLIVTKEVSRFARNTVDALSITRMLKTCGVGVIFLNDNIDTRDNDGEFRLTIMASVAQEESRKISERTRWGQAQAMKRGVVFGNDSIYGYRLQGGRLTVIPEQAAVIRQVYQKFLGEGKGTWVIARELTEGGIDPPLRPGGAWSSTMVLRLLRSEKYAGDLLQQKYRTEDHLTHRKVLNDGREPQYYFQNHHEAIVSREDFEKVQGELARRRSLAGENRRHSGRHWYSGKIICGACGRSFAAKQTRRADGTLYRRFVCRGRGSGCGMPSVKGEVIEDCARRAAALLPLDRPGMLKTLLAEDLTVGTERERETLEQAIKRQTARRERALEAYLDGAITREDWARQAVRCEEDLTRLRGLLAEMAPMEVPQPVEALVKRELEGGPCLLSEVVRRITVREDCLLVSLG